MTKHSKNSTARPVYTYHERKKDTRESKYGTRTSRLGADSHTPLDCCEISLQTARDPVVTPWGCLFDREAILEYILKQKHEIARRLKEYERLKQKTREEKRALETARSEEQLRKFVDSTAATSSSVSTSSSSSSSEKNPKSFWMPSLTPSAKECENAAALEKPDEVVRCPITGRPISMRDLIAVKFTPIDQTSSASAAAASSSSASASASGSSTASSSSASTNFAYISAGGLGLCDPRNAKYKCAVTGDPLYESTPCAVLRQSGSVVTMDAIDRVIRVGPASEWRDPVTGAPIGEKDIIRLLRGASGFSGSGLKLTSCKYTPALNA